MADSISHNTARSRPRLPSQEIVHSIAQSKPTFKDRSCRGILCKSLLVLIFLVAIPLFPSQAPSFIDQTPFTKFWELVHLLFVGVAVCYGLFSCRSTNFNVNHETESAASDDSQYSYLTRILNFPSIFDDGFENTCGSDEKNAYRSWNSRDDYSMVTVADDGSVVNEQRKSGSLYSENGLQDHFESDEDNAIEAWNSQCLRGESTIVVSQPIYTIDEFGENGHKPLGLPVRSLNSRISKQVSPESSNESESDLSLNGLCMSGSSEKNTNEAMFGNMCPINLEEKFNDTVSWPSKVPRGLTSGKMEMRENAGSFASGFSHLRPLSADETQFDSIKSHSFRSTTSTSFSSQTSSASYSPTGVSPLHSAASGLLNSETEELGKNSYSPTRASYPPDSRSPLTTMNNGSRLNAFHLRRYSSGSLFQKDSQKSLRNELKNLGGNIRKDSLSSPEKGQSYMKSDKNSKVPVRSPSMGKSVRTIRASGHTAEGRKVEDVIEKQQEAPVGETSDEAKAAKLRKNEIRGRRDGIAIGTNRKSLDDILHLPKSTFEKYKKDREEDSENVPLDKESKIGNFCLSSDKDAAIGTDCQAGDDPNEVDKKAGEFIAKFREQIRLQKVESMERSRRFRRARSYV
uniref:Uncharacterized protein LOC105643196 n=1 Tax=Rhizophora mucronata TaxID=61149 RepID=A0A2P2JRH6_RHIMU